MGLNSAHSLERPPTPLFRKDIRIARPVKPIPQYSHPVAVRDDAPSRSIRDTAADDVRSCAFTVLRVGLEFDFYHDHDINGYVTLTLPNDRILGSSSVPADSAFQPVTSAPGKLICTIDIESLLIFVKALDLTITISFVPTYFLSRSRFYILPFYPPSYTLSLTSTSPTPPSIEALLPTCVPLFPQDARFTVTV